MSKTLDTWKFFQSVGRLINELPDPQMSDEETRELKEIFGGTDDNIFVGGFYEGQADVKQRLLALLDAAETCD